MTENMILMILNPIIDNLGICFTIIIIGLKIISLLKDKNKLAELKYDNEINNISTKSNNTKEFHEFLKFLITETTITKFQKFRMNNDISKSNRSSVQQLISEIASEVFGSFKNKNDIFNDSNILTDEYYMQYITDITIVTVDKIMDSAVDDSIII